MKSAVLFLVSLLFVGVFFSFAVSADLFPPSADNQYTINNALWGFEGNIIQNGQSVPVMFGFVNLSWKAGGKKNVTAVMGYLNLNGSPLIAYTTTTSEISGKGSIHLDMVPLGDFTNPNPDVDTIRTIVVDIPFNSPDKILSGNEISSNNVKISQFYRDVSFLNNNALTFPATNSYVSRNITIDNWRKAVLNDINAGDYLTITSPYIANNTIGTDPKIINYINNHADISSLYDFLGNPFGDEGVIGIRTDVSSANKVSIFSCGGSAYGGDSRNNYTSFKLNCNSVCFNEEGFISLIKSTENFCHIYNIQLNLITSGSLDLRKVIFVNPQVEQATGWSDLEW